MTKEEAKFEAEAFQITLEWRDIELISHQNADGRTRTITHVLPAPKDFTQNQKFLSEFVKNERPLDEILNELDGIEYDIYLLFSRLSPHEVWRFEAKSLYYNY